MTRKNAQTLVVIAAALAVGVAAWFADDLAGYWRAAQPPAGYQGAGGGGGQASPRVDPPSQAFVPPFDAPKMTNTELLAHYVKQMPLEKSPTLDEWQKLLDELPKEMLGAAGTAGGAGGAGGVPVTLPLGKNHFVMAMCADLGGNLWIGTEGEGIFRYNPSKPTAEQWAQFTTKDGLGDDYGYAMACDQQGRVWVGHLNHGVSVFNGEKWQTYEVVGGLSRPDTLNGPLGERIFKIAVCPLQATVVGAPVFHDALTDKDNPMAGSVWMASSAGLAIFFPATDTWSYVTRAEGLPSDQANAIVFDRDGTVYVGTQCDGIAVSGPQDHYATWKQVTAANPTPHAVDGKIVDVPVPVAGKGAGLPTDLINDLLVAKDGTVYAATTLGLAWSTDDGNSWQYVRGADWGDKVQNRLGGAPQGWQPPTDVDHGGGILSEDYTTTLAEDADGNLLVGHRAASGDILAPQVMKKLETSANLFVTSFVSIPSRKNAFRGTYGDGLSTLNVVAQPEDTAISSDRGSRYAEFPRGAQSPSLQRLAERVNRLNDSSNDKPVSALSLEDDWVTAGDWIDRYGEFYSVLCAQGGGSNFAAGYRAAYAAVRAGVGEQGNDSLRYWVFPRHLGERRDLQCLDFGGRKAAEWDDHGEEFSHNMEGPDIYCTLKLPPGEYVISLYFMSSSGHDVDQHSRDYVLELKNVPLSNDEFRQLGSNNKSIEGRFRKASLGAHSRVREFWGGVYKRFYTSVMAPEMPTIHVSRNYSYNAVLLGVFVDPGGALCGAQGPEKQPPKPRAAFKVLGDNASNEILGGAIAEQLVCAHDARSGRYLQSRLLVLDYFRVEFQASAATGGRLAPRMADLKQQGSVRQNLAILLGSEHMFFLAERAYFGDVHSRRQTMFWEWMNKIQDPQAKPHFSAADEQEFMRVHKADMDW